MSIVVYGMDMPVSGTKYRVVEDLEGNKCLMPDGSFGGRYYPISPLPEKHGRLIDRKELEKAILKWLPPDPCGREEMEYPFETDICVSMMMEIGDQETIVEAEGE